MVIQTALSPNLSPLQLETVYRKCFRHVVAILVDRYKMSESDALDIASNVFLEVFYGNPTGYDPEKSDNPCAWIIGRAMFRAKDHFRKRERQQKLLAEFGSPEAAVVTVEDSTRRHNRERLINALEDDSKTLCELLILGYTAKQTASILQITEQEVRKRQRRLIKELTLLAERFGFSREDLLS